MKTSNKKANCGAAYRRLNEIHERQEFRFASDHGEKCKFTFFQVGVDECAKCRKTLKEHR